jgi:GT2 family glycosyltransferase
VTRVLGHIHTYNEAPVIDRSLGALRAQTHPVDGILLIDNASTDGTVDRSFPSGVEVIRFAENRLTSDPIIEAMRYAEKHGYDWIWVLNGDTAPRPDCLEKLLAFHASLAPAVRDATWLLYALTEDVTTGRCNHGFYVTDRGLRTAAPRDDAPYECDATIWSGSLYRVADLAKVGMPRSDYAMDLAEIEYGYRGRLHDLRAFVHPGAVADHNIGGASMQMRTIRLGPFSLELVELKPFRCYYVVRNVLHFWLYLHRESTPATWFYCFGKVAKLTASFAVRPLSRRRQLLACVRGFVDGILARLDYKYPVWR